MLQKRSYLTLEAKTRRGPIQDTGTTEKRAPRSNLVAWQPAGGKRGWRFPVVNACYRGASPGPSAQVFRNRSPRGSVGKIPPIHTPIDPLPPPWILGRLESVLVIILIISGVILLGTQLWIRLSR